MKINYKPLIWGCSSAGRAPALQAGGHGFESHHLHQVTKWEDGSLQTEADSKGKRRRANFRRTFATAEDRARSSRETESHHLHQVTDLGDSLLRTKQDSKGNRQWMTIRWIVRAEEDRARSSRETESHHLHQVTDLGDSLLLNMFIENRINKRNETDSCKKNQWKLISRKTCY